MKPFVPSKVAEIIFAIIFAYFGYLHFKNANMMGGGVPDFMPGDGKIWIYVIGAGFILAAIAIVIDVQKTLACYLLAGVLLLFVFTIHIKTFGTNPSGVLKDTAMAMAAIIIGNRSKG
jgi:putative oxidoreductase